MAHAFGQADPRRGDSPDRARLLVYSLLVLLCIAALVQRFGPTRTSEAVGGSDIHLSGSTEQQQPISVTLNHLGHVQALRVGELIGLCENGGRYPISWTPEIPAIPFVASGSGVTAHEFNERRSSGGIVSHTVAETTARVEDGGGYASGNLRFRTVFRYPDGRALRCDSGWVHWAVNRSGTAAGQGEATPGSWAPVHSLAVDPPPGQRLFAAEVDRTCSRWYRRYRALEQSGQAGSPARPAAAVAAHALEYVTISRVGRPSTARALYATWLANMLERIRLERAALAQRGRGEMARAGASLHEVAFLKVLGDALGQEFGLRACTSNGPLRTPADS